MNDVVSRYLSEIGRRGAINGWKRLTARQKLEKIRKMNIARVKKQVESITIEKPGD